ncbi:[protein-PII] uridylyltransferase [Alterisphingorhabdus coralli]|uniref:Bifunctional uridylyltransferase/uridylyl-removing enzyme n=1 Tax=Alterisphingorhabdus coralli TaxID=3071408 RepID=A0AA97F813_9SPHN|nr:[protein-PII] uridylyltransferase [Parasphingorhabdus sp. SCSIO 66989]WOE75186.1 [protein-PII] uridylyltransferase [Parasphingorhabdus sp. SCSIO 66989]
MIAAVPRRRAIIDRARLGEAIDRLVAHGAGDARADVLSLLRDALADGRAEIADRLVERPTSGHASAAAQAFLIDQLVRLIHDYVVTHVYPVGNATAGARLTIIAVGGYGRGEMAPHSDVDIAFITPMRKNSWTEQVTEAILYLLWDLGLKVGQSSRSLDDMVRMARDDLTIRTSLLEGRFVWGDKALYDEASARFHAEVVHGTIRDFISQKLAERDERHKRMGDSRYVVEPNVKDGKGGLRDLQTLYWIGKYAYNVRTAAELVDKKLFNMTEYRGFRRAANFFWAVRCHLHDITGRAEERLTFDLQREVAERMRYADRPGKSAVERFMQFYFLNAKKVGDLTGIFLAQIDEKFASTGRRLIPTIRRKPRKLNGFQLDRGRLITPDKDFFAEKPSRLIELFHLADKHELEIHPTAMRQATRDAKLITKKVREEPEANAMFLDILASPRDPEVVLRWMNESTVFGRFVPEFGRVVAQMQFDMYHHYTVDEHSIRAIGLLSQLVSGQLADDHPKVSEIISTLSTYRALSVAVLLHDIAKGRKGDHSILGSEIALDLGPRLGLSDAETELVAWLVRHHLLMSATAFKRDLSDYKTISDFAAMVKSPERLKLLLVLTVVDIRAVGPGIWNSWKRQLLDTLYDAAEEVLRLGHKEHGRAEKIAACKGDVAALLSVEVAALGEWEERLPESYWIAEPEDIIARNIQQLRNMQANAPLSIAAEYYPARGATLVTVIGADHPGLFYRIAGGIYAAGGNIIDARIHTTRDGMALDNFLVQDARGQAMREENQIARLKSAITDALSNRQKMTDRLDARTAAHPRADAFSITPFAIVNNNASNRFTVIEVNAQDRPALLSRLAQIFFEANMIVHSAHIATYGERAVDTFYVTDLMGAKVSDKERLEQLQAALVEVPKELDEDELTAA